MTIKWAFYNSADEPLVTQFAQGSSVTRADQNGFPAAEVASVGIAEGGNGIARYGNGEQVPIATLALGIVANPASLNAVAGNMLRPGSETANPVYGAPNTGGRGKVKAGALEASTVDMAREFTNLIVYQRGYQANSRVITTSDEMSQETLNLKR